MVLYLDFKFLGCKQEAEYKFPKSFAAIGVRRNFASGGETSTFSLSFSDCWTCSANGRSQNALPFPKHKENAPCYGNRHKNALRWQQ